MDVVHSTTDLVASKSFIALLYCIFINAHFPNKANFLRTTVYEQICHEVQRIVFTFNYTGVMLKSNWWAGRCVRRALCAAPRSEIRS